MAVLLLATLAGSILAYPAISDHLPEAAFYMVGTIEEAVEKAREMAAEAA